MCSSGSQALELGGWRESFLGMYCLLHTVNHERGTCPSDLAALIEFYYGKQFEHVCYCSLER